MEKNAAVVADKVDKSYGGRPIFKNLSLSIPRSQFTVLLGKNGSGKSTLLRLIAGQEPADKGELQALGLNVETESIARRQKVAFISEQITLDLRYKLKDIIRDTRPLYPNWDETLLDKFIHNFNLNLNSRFGTLSRGQRVQFFFAVAAASKPELYLLDEVTSVLDANARFEVMNHLRTEVSKGVSVMLATNIASETHNFANEIVFLVDGKLGLSCSVEDLQHRFAKFRVSVEHSATFAHPPQSRPVQLNGDGSISYIIPIDAQPREAHPAVIDLRGVTIEDLFVFFTGPEKKS